MCIFNCYIKLFSLLVTRALLSTKRMYRTSQYLYKSHSFNDYLQSSRSSQAGNVAEQEI